MNRTRSRARAPRIALALLLVGGSACAARCDRIDYAEAKDWPVDQLEATYCQYAREAQAAIDERTALYSVRGTNETPRSRQLTQEATGCFEAASALGRVIKNVHRRPYPACAKP